MPVSVLDPDMFGGESFRQCGFCRPSSRLLVGNGGVHLLRNISIIVGCMVLCAGVAVYAYYSENWLSGIIAGLVVAFWIAIAVGIVVRFMRARRGKKIRDAFGPVMAAGDTYQSLLLGRPTADESRAKAANPLSTDKYTADP